MLVFSRGSVSYTEAIEMDEALITQLSIGFGQIHGGEFDFDEGKWTRDPQFS